MGSSKHDPRAYRNSGEQLQREADRKARKVPVPTVTLPAEEVEAWKQLEAACRQSGGATAVGRDIDAALARLDAVRNDGPRER